VVLAERKVRNCDTYGRIQQLLLLIQSDVSAIFAVEMRGVRSKHRTSCEPGLVGTLEESLMLRYSDDHKSYLYSVPWVS
jgi:hypothetical protein